jgi:hypothetical protein
MSLKLKYRSLTVIDTVDDSLNLAQKIHELKSTESIRHSNYRVLTVENVIEKTGLIPISEDALDLQIKKILTPE